MTFGVLKQLPILPPDFYTDRRLAFFTPKVLELTYTSHSLAPFVRDLGHDGPPFAWARTVVPICMPISTRTTSARTG
jgi:hypothetical protein